LWLNKPQVHHAKDMSPINTTEICVPENDLPKVVVIGAGFAGINFIKKLKNKPVQLILLDENNFHQFQPLLYQVAISGLEPDSIVMPIRKLFQGYNNLIYRMAKVEWIDTDKSCVQTDIGMVKYDHLIIATGSTTNFYGSKNIELHSIGLKNIQNAINLRSWILQNLEKAVDNCNDHEKRERTKFIIVGGGPAGVEMAGAIAEFKRYLLKKEYPEIVHEWMKIFLIEAGDRILPAMSERASKYAMKILRELEVDVLLNTQVKDYDGKNVLLEKGNTIQASTVIWTAGVKGSFSLF